MKKDYSSNILNSIVVIGIILTLIGLRRINFCFSKVNCISDEHRGQVIDGQIIMRVDIYYRFIGKVGTVDSNSLPAPRIRRDAKLLKATSVLPTAGD